MSFETLMLEETQTLKSNFAAPTQQAHTLILLSYRMVSLQKIRPNLHNDDNATANGVDDKFTFDSLHRSLIKYRFSKFCKNLS